LLLRTPRRFLAANVSNNGMKTLQMDSFKRITLFFLTLIIANTANCQFSKFNFKNYSNSEMTFEGTDYSTIQKELKQNWKINKISLDNFFNENSIYSFFSNSKKIYLCKVNINKNLNSVIILSLVQFDTAQFNENIKVQLHLLNFNLKNELVSSAMIGNYELTNDGLSLSQIHTKLKFKHNHIKINLFEILYPTDIGINSRLTKEDYTKKYNYTVVMKNDGMIIQIK